MHPTHQHPRPLSMLSAARTLLQWVEIQSSAFPSLPHATRLEIPVHPGHPNSLVWLRAQPFPQKLFFRSRSNVFEIAAIGFLHVASGPVFTEAAHLALVDILNPHSPTQRFYGATRFNDSHASRRDLEWTPYQGYTFVLPAVELYRNQTGQYYLAANFYAPAGLQVLHSVLTNILPTSLTMQTLDPAAMIPRAVHVTDLTHFPAWHAAMTSILQALSSRQYDKIVLARRKRFRFSKHANPNPIHILAALDDQNNKTRASATRSPTSAHVQQLPDTEHRSTYLFCLQLNHHNAFLGCTPERLFRLEGSSILTEALAGTVRRCTNGSEGDVLSELLGPKNLEEHRFVVDYIRTALAKCGVQPETNGPHVRRLPRLMHLATHIRGQFPSASPQIQNGVCRPKTDEKPSESNVFRLLRTMHPTPAVCGMPRESTITELEKFEDFDRGLFAGPLGWFSRDAAEFCVAIRSALVHGNNVTAFAGSGIVQASESKSEWDETELKMSAFTDLFQAGYQRLNGTTESPMLELVTPLGSGDSAFRDLQMSEEEQATRYGSGDGVNSLLTVATFSGLSLGENSTNARSQGLSRSGSFKSIVPLYGTPSPPVLRETTGYFDPSQLKHVPNLNTLWGCCCIEELCRNQVTTFFVAPGSRSAPLAVGVMKSRHARFYVTHDERGAGFLAVGYARATGRAAAVITSSGTAVANLLPAVVEASMDSLPLILLTADRPPELRDVGANQAIHQSGIFALYTVWSKDVPCPCEQIPLRNLLSDVDYAVYKSGSGCQAPPSPGSGPVHLNMMFREKLAPDQQAWDRKYVADMGQRWQDSLFPLTHYQISPRTRPAFGNRDLCVAQQGIGGAEVEDVLCTLETKRAGIIILGGGSGCARTEDDAIALYEIADILGWPVISDVCGGVRFHKPREQGRLIHYADQILTSKAAMEMLIPDAVLQFGERITSKRIYSMITSASKRCGEESDFVHVIVSNSTKRCDQSFTVTHFVRSDISEVLQSMLGATRPLNGCTESVNKNGVLYQTRAGHSSELMILTDISEKIDKALEEMMTSGDGKDLTEPWCARVLSTCLARPSGLFIGSSMPIRDFDSFGSGTIDGIKLRVAANRGASGIDGIVSSGIGFGIGLNLDVTIVLGDMSMMHDLNALHILRSENDSVGIDVTIVVVNNGGGGIFSILPIAAHRDVFSPVFDTPHSVQFRRACEMFGIEYSAVRSVDGLRKVLQEKREGRHRMIEALVSADHASNAALHQRLGAAVSQQVSSFFAAKS